MSALKKDITIKIKGLKNGVRNWRNGRIGIIKGKYTDKKGGERWKVKIIGEDGKSENYLGLKPENIEIYAEEGKEWKWLGFDGPIERPETPPSEPQSPKNTRKGGRTRKKIRKRKKRKSRRKKRKQKKKKKSLRRR